MLRFKDLREDKDLLQKDIANVVGISQQQYSRIEMGINQANYEQLTKFAKYYNTSVDYIIGLTDIKEPYKRNK